MRVSCLVAISLLGASPVAAQDSLALIPNDAGPMPDRQLRLDLGIAYDLGSLTVGAHHEVGEGFQLTGGLRFDQIAFAAELGEVWADASVRRVVVSARYSPFPTREISYGKHSGRPLGINRVDHWLELAAGREREDLGGMRAIARTTVALGFALETSERDARQHFGASLGLRVIRGQRDDGVVDHEVMVMLGVMFGN